MDEFGRAFITLVLHLIMRTDPELLGIACLTLSKHAVHHSFYYPHLLAMLAEVGLARIAPPIPAAIRVVGAGRDLWVEHNNVVGRRPAVVACIPDEVVGCTPSKV